MCTRGDVMTSRKRGRERERESENVREKEKTTAEGRWKHCKTKCFVGRNFQPRYRVAKCNKNRFVSPTYSPSLFERIWKRARLHVVRLNTRAHAPPRDNAHRMKLIMIWREKSTGRTRTHISGIFTKLSYCAICTV